MFYEILLSPQVKQYAINTYKHVIYEFPHGLPNELRLYPHGIFTAGGTSVPTQEKKDLRYEKIRKYQENV